MEKPVVGIVMGSRSDLPVMNGAVQLLEEFGVGFELLIASAHRQPEKVDRYARGAAENGLRVIIAGAGGAAHLPGVIAARTILPVIGVPVTTPHLGGLDSLYSIVQMPRGIPVATVSINGAANAALLALEILALQDENLRRQLNSYRRRLAAADGNKETDS